MKCIWIIALIGFAALGSCRRSAPAPSEHTALALQFSMQPASKATPVNQVNQMENMGVFCAATGLSLWNPAVHTTNKMYNTKLINTRFGNPLATDAELVYDNVLDQSYWNIDDREVYSFFAYTPYALPNNGLRVNPLSHEKGYPLVDVVVPTDVLKQVDLMISKPVIDTKPVSVVDLGMEHAMSQVTFKVWSEQKATVQSLSVGNVAGEGTVALDGVTSWTVGTQKKIFPLGFSTVSVPISTAANPVKVDLSAGGRALMMVPQDLSAQPGLLTVVFTYGPLDKQHTATVNLKERWEPGKAYNYVLRLRDLMSFDLGLSVEIIDWNEGYLAQKDLDFEEQAKNYVKVGNLYWATGHLVADGANGCRVGVFSDYGLYFQFGSLIGWSGGASGDGKGKGSPALAVKVVPSGYKGSTDWVTAGRFRANNGIYGLETNFSNQAGGAINAATGVGDPCTFYLGIPWRLPTGAEVKAVGRKMNGDDGSFPLVYAEDPRFKIDASGFRDSAGKMVNAGSSVFFTTCSIESSTNLYAGTGSLGSGLDVLPFVPLTAGLAARCVRETP